MISSRLPSLLAHSVIFKPIHICAIFAGYKKAILWTSEPHYKADIRSDRGGKKTIQVPYKHVSIVKDPEIRSWSPRLGRKLLCTSVRGAANKHHLSSQ